MFSVAAQELCRFLDLFSGLSVQERAKTCFYYFKNREQRSRETMGFTPFKLENLSTLILEKKLISMNLLTFLKTH